MSKVLLLTALIPAAAFAQQDYSVNFMAGQDQITGNILLSSGASGPLVSSDVLSYSITGSGADPFAISGDSSSVASAASNSALTIENGAIVFTAAPYVTAGTTSTEDVNPIDFTTFSYVRFESPDPLAGSIAEDGGQGMQFINGKYGFGSLFLSDGQVLATSSPSAAPEIDPQGAVEGLTLLAGGLLLIRGRRPARLRS